jgi:phage I-like protein
MTTPKSSAFLSQQASSAGLATSSAVRFAIALASEGKAPIWVMLIPAGRVDTNDGRWFDNNNPDLVIAAFTAGGLHLPFDFEHASEILAPMGEYAPAAGWIVELANREGAIWGKVEWTDKGRAAIEAKEVKYISPAFNYSYETHEVLKLTSAALTVRPAISTLPAIAAQQLAKGEIMNKKALCAALGLAETASEEDILAAIAKGKSDLALALASSQAPALDRFVPRSDYDLVATERNSLKLALASRDADGLKAEAEAVIAQAITDAKIAPASKEFYLGTCATRAGLDSFKAFATSAPAIVATKAAGDLADPKTGQALTSLQKQVAKGMGMSFKDYAAQLAANAADEKEAE